MRNNQRKNIRCISSGFKTLGILLLVMIYQFFGYDNDKTSVLAYEEADILINDFNVANLTEDELKNMINNQINQYKERQITVLVGDKVFETKLKQFNPTVKGDINQLVNEIMTIGKDLELMEQVSQLKEPMHYELAVEYTYDSREVERWVRLIEKEVYIEKIEPTIEMPYLRIY